MGYKLLAAKYSLKRVVISKLPFNRTGKRSKGISSFTLENFQSECKSNKANADSNLLLVFTLSKWQYHPEGKTEQQKRDLRGKKMGFFIHTTSTPKQSIASIHGKYYFSH